MTGDLVVTDIEKALTFLHGIAGGDAGLATRYINADRYLERDPRVGDGVEGVRRYLDQIASEKPELTPELMVVRTYRDGSYVFTQADGHIRDDGTFFDVFRFENGLVVEHWRFSAKAEPPNGSGHTQVDGPTEPKQDEDTGTNKAVVRDYYETVHLGGRHDAIPRYMDGNRCVRHEPGVTDGVDAFMRDLETLTRDRTIDEIKLLLGQGDFVFIAAKGTHAGEPCVYIDLYRVESGKIVEHWGFPQPVPPVHERGNDNGML